MRNIWTIARRELRAYFDHPTAYILLVVFLVINNFFFFRGFFLLGEASLRPMFDLLPWILLFFVPAVTMGSLAEEKRHGTLEVTLSHPIHEHEFMLGKYLGDVLFLAIALTATLPIPLLMTLGGTPDLGVVVAQYVGALLLIAGMAAVGVFASALTRNQITAFIVGTMAIFILMMVGTEVVQIGMPSFLAEPLGRLGILSHFGNVARGVIDLRDVVYFVALAVAFLALAYWLLLRDRLSHGSRLYRNLRLGTVTIVAIAIVANLFGGYIPGRIDLTAENLYTLSDGTRRILSELDDVVTITLYTSDELPAQVRPLARDINDVLRDFDRYGGGEVQVVRKYPDESEEARQEAQRLNIRPVQFNVVRREELQLKQGWMGIAVAYAGESEVIPFVGETRNLEYQLAANVWRLTRERTPKVAFISGHGEKAPGEYRAFSQALREAYEVSTIDLNPTDTAAARPSIDPELDAVIVAGPKRALDAQSLAILRRYLQNDGRIFYLGEGVDVNLRFLFASAVPDSALDLGPVVGVEVNGDLVYDLQSNESISVPGEVFSYVVPYPFWVRALPVQDDHAITRGLNSVFLPWPSSLDTTAAGGGEVIPLLATTRYAGRQRGDFQIRPDQDIPYDQQNLERLLLAVALDGVIARAAGGPTAGADAAIQLASGVRQDTAAPAPQDDTVAADAQEPGARGDTARVIDRQATEGPPVGRAVVVGDADFLGDNFVRNAPENLVFGLNAVDWLTQTEALLAIRSKTPTPRPLIFESDTERAALKYINLAGVPLAFVLLGAFRMLRRRRLTRRTYAA